MSYCRWSSDNFKCDVYVYQNTNGYYTTSVAASRITGDVPTIDWSTPDTLYESSKAHIHFMESCPRELIGLPCDGMTFEDDSLTDLCACLVKLQSMGYAVPAWVIDNVCDELEGLDVSDD
jgi:hypothetical protein